MPRRDGTGPMGLGPMTGGGFGFCAGNGAMGRGCGLGMALRCGWGNGWAFRGYANPNLRPSDNVSRKEFLTRQKEVLENRLQLINRQMDSL